MRLGISLRDNFPERLSYGHDMPGKNIMTILHVVHGLNTPLHLLKHLRICIKRSRSSQFHGLVTSCLTELHEVVRYIVATR